jgi:hypothetical protein
MQEENDTHEKILKEPIFCGWLPDTIDGQSSINYEELIHNHECWVDADYFHNLNLIKKSIARNTLKFVLASINYKKIEMPSQSRVASCEIIYKNFSIDEIRLSCEYPSQFDLNENIRYGKWTTDNSPKSTFNEYLEFSLNFPPEEEFYFIYHLVRLGDDLPDRMFSCFNIPQLPNFEELQDKDLISLPY